MLMMQASMHMASGSGASDVHGYEPIARFLAGHVEDVFQMVVYRIVIDLLTLVRKTEGDVHWSSISGCTSSAKPDL